MKNPGTACSALLLMILASGTGSRAATLYVSPAGSNTAPYTNWTTAATMIQTAVAAASSNDTVLVTNGTYNAGIVVTDIRVESVNGPGVTIAEKTTFGRCFYLQGSAVLSGFTVQGGDASGVNGGGVLCEDSSQIVTNCIISGNTAYNGGGMYNGTAYNCIITGNTAEYGGGMYGGTAIHCKFSVNSAYGAGGLYNGTAINCLFSENTAHNGGAMVLGKALNCTISDNVATNVGGGIWSGTATNSIIWYNTANSSQNIYAGNRSFTCSPDATHGVDGNITNAPAFVDKNSGNYHLLYGSSCINAGANGAVEVGYDLDGAGRIVDTTVDMGAYEYDLNAYDSDGDGLTDGDEVNVYATEPLNADTDNDDMTDGYEINISGTDPLVFDVTSVHYVSQVGSHAYPFATWSSASTNIQGAVAAAEGGDTVLVSNGTYTAGIIITDLRIESLNGPEVTIAQRTIYGRCFYLKGTAVLSGFTVTGGDATGLNGGGVLCDDSSQMVTNCIIAGNVADYGGGMYRGTVVDSVITNNLATLHGGGVYAVSATNCAISGNVAFLGGGSYDSSVEHCDFTGNTAAYGGGMHSGTANRSGFSANTATNYGGGQYSGTANNSLFYGNSAGTRGGAISDGTAYNCTVSSNSADYGGGLYAGNANNTIVWYNTALISGNDIYGGTTAQYSCSPDLVSGMNGNITSIPMFFEKDTGDYRLPYGSPCINAGNNAYASGSNDLAGAMRIIDGIVDIGAYEYDPVTADSDGDGLLDEYEAMNGLSPILYTDLGALVQSNAAGYGYYTPAYIESNPETFGLYASNAVLDLMIGDIGMAITNGMVELSVQLWQSDDLVTWTNIGGTVYWAEPVDADKKFWRIRAEP